MSCTGGGRIPLVGTRAFWKGCKAGSAWCELPINEFNCKINSNVENSYAAGMNYAVRGNRMIEASGTMIVDGAHNYQSSPYNFADGQSGQVQLFITDPPSDSQKYVINCMVKDADIPLHKDKGEMQYKFNLSQNGPFYLPGNTIPTGSADTYATINPDNDPPVMLPS